ncbi:hypothetical protein [Streptomyces halstedii]|uniref:Uncharacterized protein n=1 Tax=Streptomyces halstedii TaxID=1944 RepID=A0A6N9UAD8_STRHA|nr:hypothetical protein [Streptomyces halstedii]NEA18966.1 hypothetical protein [Streptomyces halstedii]
MYALVARLPAGALTAGDTPTIEAAAELLDRVTLDARHLIRLAVEGDGRALGADFRAQRGEGRLNGATTSLTCAVKALSKEGRWPASVPGVLISTKAGPEGYRKTHAFTMPSALVPVFRAALRRHDKPADGNPEAALGHLAELYEEMGRPAHIARELAQDFLERHAGDLAVWAGHRMAKSPPDSLLDPFQTTEG